MMNEQTPMITMLREEFNRWEGLLNGISEEQIIAPNRVEKLSVKDIMAHLTAWQQISVARMEAGRDDREPVFAGWPPELDPVGEHDVNGINAWIYDKYREQSWASVHYEWRERFLHLLELAEATPEKVLVDKGRFAWLNGYSLWDVLTGSYEHHAEHREPLDAMFGTGRSR
jgi:hypothetical protein